MRSNKVFGFCPSSKVQIDNICINNVSSSKGGLAIPSKVAKDMIDLLDKQDFFSIEPYIINGKFSKEDYANNHRVLDICCNSGILLELCYYKFMSELTTLETQKYFKSNSDIEDYILKELLFAFVPDQNLCIYLRERFYHNANCHGNIYNYDACSSTGKDKFFVQLHNSSIILGGIDLKFDVVCGNPPYNDDMYIDFVLLGHSLAKKYDIWITPAKFMSKEGSKNEEFRNLYLSHIFNIVYYPEHSDIFDIMLRGGIAYYISDNNVHSGSITISNKSKNCKLFNSTNERVLNKCLLNVGNSIVSKLGDYTSLSDMLNLKRNLFTNEYEQGYAVKTNNSVAIYAGTKGLLGYIDINDVKNKDLISKYKLTISHMSGAAEIGGDGKILGLNSTYIVNAGIYLKLKQLILLPFTPKKYKNLKNFVSR